MTIHATAVAIGDRAVLLRGPPGAGKSDLALRLLALPHASLAAFGMPALDVRLVADDRVTIEVSDDRLLARAPERLRGYLEIRGLGITPVTAVCAAAIVMLVVDLTESMPRLPDPTTVVISGVSLPLLAMRPFDAATPLKIALALLQATAPSKTHPPG